LRSASLRSSTTCGPAIRLGGGPNCSPQGGVPIDRVLFVGMLDHGPFGVDLDNHVLEIDVRQQHPILRAWVASLMADFLGAVVAYAEAWARRILCLTSL